MFGGVIAPSVSEVKNEPYAICDRVQGAHPQLSAAFGEEAQRRPGRPVMRSVSRPGTPEPRDRLRVIESPRGELLAVSHRRIAFNSRCCYGVARQESAASLGSNECGRAHQAESPGGAVGALVKFRDAATTKATVSRKNPTTQNIVRTT